MDKGTEELILVGLGGLLLLSLMRQQQGAGLGPGEATAINQQNNQTQDIGMGLNFAYDLVTWFT